MSKIGHNKPPRKIGIYFIFVKFLFSNFFISLNPKYAYGLLKSK